ncbi:MAG TPA: YMGG-like glycine zipper-containing protein [Flavisolibacter sp.]|jgi:hypothetical protein|nr:YMGG-like glycine zipper-containing protein [Flavisolibacter sp.]
MKQLVPNTRIMKRFIPFFMAASFMVACNSAPRVDASTMTKPINPVDTAGLAQYQAWKAQNELIQANQYGEAEQLTATAPQTTQRSTAPVRRASSSSSGRSRTVSNTSSSSNTAKAKKGWSKAAKGAAIGGGAGAVIGAVINKKNRVAGGIIGGVLGAGVGYGIGRSKDKKDGRY